MMINQTRSLVALAAAGLLVASAPAFAGSMTFTADMNAASEVPPTASKGTGTVTATYDTETKVLTWKGTYTGLSGNAVAAHFHGPAPAGKSAGVEVAIAKADSPFEGTATLTDAQAKDLADGMLYVNVHTAANPDGEIRGQVVAGK